MTCDFAAILGKRGGRAKRKKERDFRARSLEIFIFCFCFLKSGPVQTRLAPPARGVRVIGVARAVSIYIYVANMGPVPELRPGDGTRGDSPAQPRGLLFRCCCRHSREPT